MLLLGQPVADALREQQTARIAASGLTPRLAIIQAGDDLASSTYIKMKQRYGQTIGATVDHLHCAGKAGPLSQLIETCNQDSATHGLMMQLPIPNASDTDQLVALINPTKDVDGLSPHSRFHSATAAAVVKLLDYYDIRLKGAPVTLLGYGRLVGRPLAELLKDRQARLTVCDIDTSPDNLRAATQGADIVISATGQGGLIKPDMIRDGTVLVDVGTSEAAGALVGDVDPALLQNETLKITPAKGGIGPITVALLFEHLLQAAGVPAP
jgi:methylenetetrahydrofolate dehydrogenase (NADP+)/methenyltetrahydrofolate cyclohydrolase